MPPLSVALPQRWKAPTLTLVAACTRAAAAAWRKLLVLNVARVLLLCLASVLALALWISVQVEKPYQSLEAFIDAQERRQQRSSVNALPLESMVSFASASCVQGPDIASMRVALRRQLRSLPADVLEEVLDNALIEGMSIQTSMQNSTIGTQSSGQAYAYLGFWSTEYVPVARTVARPSYSSCVMVSGVEMKVAEQVAAWDVSKDVRVVAQEPCHCGRLWCERCPKYQDVVNRRPIFKRHQLTLENHVQLHNWMIRMAISKARVLVQGRNSKSWYSWLPFHIASDQPAIESTQWDVSPKIDTFLGYEAREWMDYAKEPQNVGKGDQHFDDHLKSAEETFIHAHEDL